jgi:hypothetical protein
MVLAVREGPGSLERVAPQVAAVASDPGSPEWRAWRLAAVPCLELTQVGLEPLIALLQQDAKKQEMHCLCGHLLVSPVASLCSREEHHQELHLLFPPLSFAQPK